MEQYLKTFELDFNKYTDRLNEEGIKTVEELNNMSADEEFFEKITKDINDESEKTKWRKALKMNQEIDIDVESVHAAYARKKELEDALQEKGLNSKYWISKFEECLSISSKAALRYVDYASFVKLKRHIRFTWEKKALMELMNIENDSRFGQMREADQDKVKKRMEDAKQLISDLDDLKEKGKQLGDSGIDEKMKEIRAALQIPDSAWISQDKKELKDVIASFENLVTNVDGIDRKDLSESDVLQSASAGLTLKGLLLSKKFEEGDYCQVLAPPNEVKFLGTAISPKVQINSFTSKTSKSNFTKALENYGYSVAASVKGSYGLVSAEVGGSYSNNKENEEERLVTSSVVYYGQVKYEMIPLASYTFHEDQLKLTEECIEELQKLEKVITATTIKETQQSACEKFFRKYGSHVNCGPIHFGGTFYWISDYYSETHQDRKTVKKLSEEAMGAFVNVSYAGMAGVSTDVSAKSLKGSFTGEFDESELQKTSLRIETKGGPSECSALPQWKTGLVLSNATWSVIDRGHNFKGIWELLKIHAQRFSDASDFETNLCKAWESMTGLTARQYLANKELLEAQNDLDELLSEIPTYLEDNLFSQNCASYLQTLAKGKTKAIVRTFNPDIWCKAIQQKTDMINLLELVFKHRYSYDPLDLSAIKSCLKQILTDTDDFSFKSKIKLTHWIRSEQSTTIFGNTTPKASDIVSFITSIQSHVIPQLQDSQDLDKSDEEKDKRAIEATCNFSFLTKDVLESLVKNGETNTNNLLKLLLYQMRYSFNGGYYSSHDVTFERVKWFLAELDAKNKELSLYETKGQKELDGFILEIVYEFADKKDAMEQKLLTYSNLLDVLDLSEDCAKFIKSHGKPPTDWIALQLAIASRKDGIEESSGPIAENLGHLFEEPERQDVKISPSENNETSDRSSISLEKDLNKMQILETLGLSKFYPNKITLSDVRKNPIEKVKTFDDLPWYLLTKILLLDYRGRNQMQISQTMDQNDAIDERQDDSENDDDLLRQIMEEESCCEDERINPMDVMVALFLCSSNFLKQLLSQKLSMCKLSIPFLVPDITNRLVLQIWPLRDIVLGVKDVQVSALKAKLPIITFVRTGEIPRSKSKLLNELLSDQSHNMFFHQDCKNGDIKSVLSQGTVDTSWYLPSNRARCSCSAADDAKRFCQCHFLDTMMFLNLHGKCEDFGDQLRFLCKVSNMMVVMVDIDEIKNSNVIKSIKNIAEFSEKVLLVVTKKQGIVRSKSAVGDLLKEVGSSLKKFELLIDFKGGELKNKNLGDFKSEIIAKVNKHLNNFDSKTLLEALEEGDVNGESLISDEDNIAYQTGQMRAQDIYDVIKGYKIYEAKAKLLPLQGDLWKRWGEIKKKENRTSQMHGIKSVEHYQSELYRERQELRRRQVLICENLSKVMKQFIHNLLGLSGDARLYFIHWLRIYLDELSRAELPTIEHNYSEVWSKLQNLLKKKDNQATDQILYLKSLLSDLERRLEESSFGWEHLLREMGQIFEAVMDLKDEIPLKVVKDTGKLPKIMAELLLAGYPMEIMDGNAAHVPLKWIQAVFTEVKSFLGSKKMFVLSVLGIQSSGKSTLLNTMFGLQFAVRAGRCTQGVFAQLIQLPENRANQECDYIMVVDTEGLRAPELGFEKHQHDNELATLAIGIGDLTIINIKGENQSEIQDVLQIVVHAFVRMQLVNKNLKLKSSCFFIHQNVGADNAEKNMQRGRNNLLKRLDEMAQAAAQSEKIINIKKFSDIINFDVESNVKNFTNLWQGEPPMAPVNPGYSEKVEEVRKYIYEVMPARKSHSTIENMSIRIGDLWRGILADDFVFNFRNSLEIKAFNSLELKRNNLSFTMKNEVLEWFNDIALGSIRAASNPNSEKTELAAKLTSLVGEKHGKALNDLKEFFATSEDPETIEQWKAISELKLSELKDDIIRATLKAIEDEVSVTELKITQRAQFSKWNKEISKKTSALAIELRGETLTEDELYSRFDSLWIEMQAKQPPRASAENTLNVKNEVYLALLVSLAHNTPLLKKNLETGSLGTPVPDLFNFPIKEEYYSAKKYLKMPERFKKMEDKFERIAHGHTQDALKKIPVYLKKIEDQNFSKSQVEKLMNDVVNFINEWNEDEKRSFLLTQEYEVSLLVHVCRFALSRFEKMHEAFKKKIDPSIEENLFKQRLFITFKNIYERSANEKIAADLLCHIIKNHVKSSVNLSLPLTCGTEVRNNHTFMGSAGLLKTQVLKELLKLNSFKEYEAFIDKNRACISRWLLKYINNYLFTTNGGESRNDGKPKYVVLAKVKLDSLLTNIESIITSHFTSDIGKADVKVYWATFTEALQKVIPVTSEEIAEVSKTETFQETDFKNLSSILLKNLSTIRDDLYGEYDAVIQLPEGHGQEIVNNLADSCLGCQEQCPFCKAPCKVTSPQHSAESNGMDHCVIEHYPQGVGGYSWTGSNKLITDTCSTLVCSESRFRNHKTNQEWKNYKDYKMIYPKWSIPKDDSLETACYWKRFMAKFNSSLAIKYNLKEGDIPETWHNFTEEQAVESVTKLV